MTTLISSPQKNLIFSHKMNYQIPIAVLGDS